MNLDGGLTALLFSEQDLGIMMRVEQKLRGLCRVLLVTKDDEGFLMRVLPRFREVVEQLDQESRQASQSKGKSVPGEVMRVSDHEIRQLVAQAGTSLTETQRRVLKLAYFDGLTLKEIAERMEESLGNVRHHYYRGLNRLRERT